jgi:hypothetical protein
LGNDLLCQTPDLFIVTVLELGLRHVDRSLLLRDHDRREIAIDVPVGATSISRVILLMASSLANRDCLSSACLAAVRKWSVSFGAWANANDVAVTDRVAASEMIRRRMNARESTAI